MQLTQNHFELFGFPVAFDIDQQQLAARYRELQKALHPDRFASASDRERRLSIQHAAQINEAYQTLKSVLPRARYLLELRGVNFNDEQDTHFDAAFLMEQMELREALAEVRQAADPLGVLGELLLDIRARSRAMEEQLQQLLQDDSAENRQAAKQLVQKLQFFRRLQQEAEETEEDLLDSL